VAAARPFAARNLPALLENSVLCLPCCPAAAVYPQVSCLLCMYVCDTLQVLTLDEYEKRKQGVPKAQA
jgi:hypothetical protein